MSKIFVFAVALTCPFSALLAQAGTCSLGNAKLWCAHQDLAAVAGVAQPNDRFGAALAVGDFNGDGHQDLAVGSPGEADGIANNAGQVHVFYGAGLQLLAAGSQVFDQDSTTDDDGGTETGDSFGAALAAADFDQDGFDDLAIGSPGESQSGPLANCGIDSICSDGGAVHILWGSASGLTTVGSFFGSDSFGNYGDDKKIGAALTVVDVGGVGGEVQLAVGGPGGGGTEGRVNLVGFSGRTVVPQRNFQSGSQEGGFPSALAELRLGTTLVHTAAGCAECTGGAPEAGAVHLDQHIGPFTELVQTDFGAAGAAADDHFGASIAVGDFDADGKTDLAIGAPNKNHGTGNPDNSGRVYIAFGPIENGVQDEFMILGESSVPGQTPAANENFGAAMVAGDFDGDGVDDLIVGAPGEFSGADGAFFPFFGSTAGLAAVTRFNEGSLGGTSADGHRFGSVFAAGDLDGDGVDELIVGVPDARVGGDAAAGVVYVSRALDPRLIFLDGFDEDGTASWSQVTP